jgi:hypothetical protein
MITYVISAKTSKDAWNAITSMFQVLGLMAAVLVRRKLFRYTIAEGANMEEQVRTLRGYQEELLVLDAAVGDKDFAFVLLTALPDSWDSFVSSLDTGDLTTNKLIGRILAEHNRRTARSPSDTTALHVQKGKDKKKSKFRKGVNCYNCGKEGHLADECRGKKADGSQNNRQNNKKPTQANHTVSTDTYEFNIYDTESYSVRTSGVWLADSTTQAHVARNHLVFTDYHKTPGAKITGAGLGPALGQGTVKLTFRVDRKDIPVTLRDVIHAPEIPNNLISLTVLEARGCTFGGANGVLDIMKDGKVIAKGNRRNNLYEMELATNHLSYTVRTGRT